jgi:hypothetical protein
MLRAEQQIGVQVEVWSLRNGIMGECGKVANLAPQSLSSPEIPTLPQMNAAAIVIAVKGPICLGSSPAAVAFVKILEELDQRRTEAATAPSQGRKTA